MTTRQRRNTKAEEVVTEPVEVDLVQYYQDRAEEVLSAVYADGVERKPWEYTNAVGRAQVYATMANTEALRAWYSAST